MTSEPVQNLSDDAFLGGRVKLLQPKSGYRAGIDAVLLAASIPCRPGATETVLDVGSGVGTVGLCAVARCPGATAVLLERSPQFVELARRNIERNDMSKRVRVCSGDLTASWSDMAGLGLAIESFDHVAANPPFHIDGRGTLSSSELKSTAHSMPETDLDLWCRSMVRMLVAGGTATMVHKADSLMAVLASLAGRIGDLRILPIYARAGQPAIRVIVQGIKGSRAPITILPGFTLHSDGNAFTAEAQAILRDGVALSFGRATS